MQHYGGEIYMYVRTNQPKSRNILKVPCKMRKIETKVATDFPSLPQPKGKGKIREKKSNTTRPLVNPCV